MTFLADTWVVWLTLSAVLIGGLVYHRHNRQTAGSLYTSADDFSIGTILLNARKGEGDIFIGYMIAIVCFSFFLAGIVRWVRTII